ncbi:AGAP001241-PA-like protein [Anopheles sinensis]|uniref:AGAP001241-PA-like protein n=1 Tax=Anopheles sinensis TaxID=74873 RepID=A0A084W052_ANOSI|nr:AGAP001241-PA-like protein [Anopheles sinensis]
MNRRYPASARPRSVEEVRARINRVPHLVAAKHRDKSSRIVGGVRTSIEEVPYQVSLRYMDSHICGGSIISYAWVLTAAHCLDWYPNNEEITVLTGSSNYSAGGSLHEVFYYHLHQDYDLMEFQWDVATIRVRTPMVGPGRAAVPLASGTEWQIGENVTVTGWGYAVPYGDLVDNLQLVRLEALSRAACNESWTGYITDDMICAGGVDVDACDGDSGGPAVQAGVQYGIVSWGDSECGSGLPGVFTNIAHPSVRNFIWRTTMV